MDTNVSYNTPRISSATGIEQPVSETEGCMGIASDICKQVILTI